MMTRQEFIGFYNAPLDWKTEYGLLAAGQKQYALPCFCSDFICEGWAMVPELFMFDYLLNNADEQNP